MKSKLEDSLLRVLICCIGITISITKKYGKHNIFGDVDEEYLSKTLYACYPLHPVSTFVLPRLSERVTPKEVENINKAIVYGGVQLYLKLE